DPLVVGGDHEPVRTSRNVNRLGDLVASSVDHADGVVAEQTDVCLRRDACGVLCRGNWTGASGQRRDGGQRSAHGRNPRCQARAVNRKSEMCHVYCPPRAELIGRTGGLSCPALGSFRPLSITAERPLGWLLAGRVSCPERRRRAGPWQAARATWTSDRGQHARNGTGQAAIWTPLTAYSSSATIR